MISKQTVWENNLIYNRFGEDLQIIKIWKCTENVEGVIRSHLSKNRQLQWPKKWQKDKQWSTKHYTDNQYWIMEKNTKNWSVPLVIPIMTHVTNSVISHEWEKVKIVAMTNKYIHGHLWHINSLKINQVMTVTVKSSKWWLQLNRWFCSFLVITEILIGTTSFGIMYQKCYPF